MRQLNAMNVAFAKNWTSFLPLLSLTLAKTVIVSTALVHGAQQLLSSCPGVSVASSAGAAGCGGPAASSVGPAAACGWPAAVGR